MAALTAELRKQHACLHADETPVRQLDPSSGKTRHAYLWAYRAGVHDAGPPIVMFDYETGRAGAHARAFLQGWRGHLMVDDYAGYKAMFADGSIELACLAHIRCKFFDVQALAAAPSPSRRCNASPGCTRSSIKLPDWTRYSEGCRANNWRCRHWLNCTTGSWQAGELWQPAAERQRQSTMRSSAGRRCSATPAQAVCRSTTTRPIAIGKKNWLFAGSERDGRVAAAIQSLFATAKLNNLDPSRWLADTLEKLPTCLNSRIDSLLPFANSTGI